MDDFKHIQSWRWPDFQPYEFACRHCGETYFWPEFFDRLQKARNDIGIPFHILSGHRCRLHNSYVGGAPYSQHLRLAADISLHNHDKLALYGACRRAGFTGFGFYSTFLHIDLGRPRHWWPSEKAKQLWQI